MRKRAWPLAGPGACSVVSWGWVAPRWQGRYVPPVGASQGGVWLSRSWQQSTVPQAPAPHCPTGSKAPSLAGVSPAAARFSLLRGGGASRQRHCPVNRRRVRGKMALRLTLLSRVDAEQPPPRAVQRPGEGRAYPRSILSRHGWRRAARDAVAQRWGLWRISNGASRDWLLGAVYGLLAAIEGSLRLV
jgi:hypothetical protein